MIFLEIVILVVVNAFIILSCDHWCKMWWVNFLRLCILQRQQIYRWPSLVLILSNLVSGKCTLCWRCSGITNGSVTWCNIWQFHWLYVRVFCFSASTFTVRLWHFKFIFACAAVWMSVMKWTYSHTCNRWSPWAPSFNVFCTQTIFIIIIPCCSSLNISNFTILAHRTQIIVTITTSVVVVVVIDTIFAVR